MNEWDYVSLKVAKLLKEKGFYEECKSFYQSIREDDKDEDCVRYATDFPFKNREKDNIRFARPSLGQARSWLIREHDIIVNDHYRGISPLFDEGIWQYLIMLKLSDDYCNIRFSDNYYLNYQDTMNDGLLEALKLI